MPIHKSAKKKMRHDEKITLQNRQKESKLRQALKNARKTSSAENLQTVASVLDRAVKINLIHRNKAARLKSRIFKKAAVAA